MTDDTKRSAALAGALSHPIRVEILKRAAGERTSPLDVADQTEQPLANVAYHFRTLHGLGLIRKAGTKPVRGAVQHFYVTDPGTVRELSRLRATIDAILEANRGGADGPV